MSILVQCSFAVFGGSCAPGGSCTPGGTYVVARVYNNKKRVSNSL